MVLRLVATSAQKKAMISAMQEAVVFLGFVQMAALFGPEPVSQQAQMALQLSSLHHFPQGHRLTWTFGHSAHIH